MTSLTITRLLDKDPARVWRAWTDPVELAAWMWPPTFGTRCDVDLRPGGTFRIAAESVGMAVGGEYVEVEEPTRLVFTWRWDGETENSLVTVTLRDTGSATELTVLHERLTTETSRDNHEQGWNDCLDRLPAHIAA